MRYRSVLHVAYFLCLIIYAASCNTLSHRGTKVTLELSFKEAVRRLTLRPTDSSIDQALDYAGQHARSIENFARLFIACSRKENIAQKQPETYFFTEGSSDTTGEKLYTFLVTGITVAVRKEEEVLKRRIEAFCNISEDRIRTKLQGNKLIIYIPGIKGPEKLQPVFKNSRGINFWATADLREIAPGLEKLNRLLAAEKTGENVPQQRDDTTSLQGLISEGKRKQERSNLLYQVFQPAVGQDGQLYGAAYIGIVAAKDTAIAIRYFNRPGIFPGNIRFLWGALPGNHTQNKNPLALYAIKAGPGGSPLVNENDISRARGIYDNNMAEISVEMNAAGAMKWQKATRNNIGKNIAMEVNNYIWSAPNVISEITGGRTSITGDFSSSEMDALVKAINSGGTPLPYIVLKTELYEDKK